LTGEEFLKGIYKKGRRKKRKPVPRNENEDLGRGKRRPRVKREKKRKQIRKPTSTKGEENQPTKNDQETQKNIESQTRGWPKKKKNSRQEEGRGTHQGRQGKKGDSTVRWAATRGRDKVLRNANTEKGLRGKRGEEPALL